MLFTEAVNTPSCCFCFAVNILLNNDGPMTDQLRDSYHLLQLLLKSLYLPQLSATPLVPVSTTSTNSQAITPGVVQPSTSITLTSPLPGPEFVDYFKVISHHPLGVSVFATHHPLFPSLLFSPSSLFSPPSLPTPLFFSLSPQNEYYYQSVIKKPAASS